MGQLPLQDLFHHLHAMQLSCMTPVQLCVEARMVLLSVLSRNRPASLPAKAAGYAYVAQFAAICRMQHLPPEHSENLCISTCSQWSESS